jgi:hypothetical protein
MNYRHCSGIGPNAKEGGNTQRDEPCVAGEQIPTLRKPNVKEQQIEKKNRVAIENVRHGDECSDKRTQQYPFYGPAQHKHTFPISLCRTNLSAAQPEPKG